MKALIVEGGAMRGVFSAGILKAFMDHDFYPFDLFVGVSAGACNLASYLARSPKRNYGGYLDLMAQKRFISWFRFLGGGDLLDLKWLWGQLNSLYPIEEKKLDKYTGSFFCVVTNPVTGEASYLTPDQHNIHDFLMASSSIPLASRDFVSIDGNLYTDGGASDPLPVQFAIDQGAKEIIVLRSRLETFRSKNSLFNYIWNFFLRKYPKLKQKLDDHDVIYNRALELIADPPDGVVIKQLVPEILYTHRTSTDKVGLNKDFDHGYQKGLEFMNASKN